LKLAQSIFMTFYTNSYQGSKIYIGKPSVFPDKTADCRSQKVLEGFQIPPNA
jgi:hypothetical protein